MKKVLHKIKGLLPTKRKLIQLYAALLFNANIKGFVNGAIYKGSESFSGKYLCAPGLNCYSCPGASGACPLGSLQNSLYSAGNEHRLPYYVFGILLLYGILLGRMICGFLCPFGLIQELLYKIKTPKLKKNRLTRLLSYFKYVVLVFFVLVVPIMYGLRHVPLPGFCKYICPAGTIEGALGLLSHPANEPELAGLGFLFTWKFMLTVSVVVGSVFIFRLFCRFICPLGALYGIFNRFSFFGIKLEKPQCTECGLCISKCKMDIAQVGDHECISCGECISVCPTKAIRFKGGRILLPPDELAPLTAEMNEAEQADCLAKTEKKNKKLARRRLVTRVVAAVLMISLLAGTLIYYNVIDQPETIADRYEDGDFCPDINIPLFNGTDYAGGTYFNPRSNTGRVTVLNFWYTSCSGCVAELPYFSQIAADFSDTVTIVALTKSNFEDSSYDFIRQNYPDSKILWGLDTPRDPQNSAAGDLLFRALGGGDAYPMTVIIDCNGKIFARETAELDYDSLSILIRGAAQSNV